MPEELVEPVGEEVLEEISSLITFDDIAASAKEYGLTLEVHEGDFNPNQVKCLVYGESGSGKTVFGSTWPDTVFVDIDLGMASVVNKVGRIPIQTFEDMRQAYAFLLKEDHGFKTVVIDSLNELQALIMDTIVDKYPNIRRAYENLPSQSDYGKLINDFDKIVRHLKVLSMNVVFIANVGEREFETDPVKPLLVGKKTAGAVTRMCDEVGFIYKLDSGDPKKNKSRVMVFDAAGYVTKDRSRVLPNNVLNPTYAVLYSYWIRRNEILLAQEESEETNGT